MSRVSNLKKNLFVEIENKCLGCYHKKKKIDEGERKYHIIRKMHAFHVFPKTVFDEEHGSFFVVKIRGDS